MRRISFIITILGLTFLIFLFLNIPTIPVSSQEELKNLSENQKISTTGLVIKENNYRNNKILTLDNHIQFQCNECPFLLNKNISLIGIIETYTGKPTIKALSIRK